MEKSEEKKSDNFDLANKKSPLREVGEFLREARQGRNLSVEDLSSSLRIGKEQLIALEAGNESVLPEKVFIRAMVRRIAEKLNLDTSFILEELNKKEKKESEPRPLIKKKNTKKIKTLNPLSMMILSGALGLLTSILVLKYIQPMKKNSINLYNEKIIFLAKNISY